MRYTRKDKQRFIAKSAEILDVMSKLDWAKSRDRLSRDEFISLASRARTIVTEFGGLNIRKVDGRSGSGAVWPAAPPSKRPRDADKADLPDDDWMVDTADEVG